MLLSPSCNFFSPQGKVLRDEDGVAAHDCESVLSDEDRSLPESCLRENHDGGHRGMVDLYLAEF
jgi:hypothetical protein